MQLRRGRHAIERQRVAVASLDHGGAGSKRGGGRKGGEAREFRIGHRDDVAARQVGDRVGAVDGVEHEGRRSIAGHCVVAEAGQVCPLASAIRSWPPLLRSSVS